MPDISDEQHEVEARVCHRLAWTGLYSRETVGALLRLLDGERARADAAEAILGRCKERSSGLFSSRCEKIAGHPDSHVSHDHGLVLWTNLP